MRTLFFFLSQQFYGDQNHFWENLKLKIAYFSGDLFDSFSVPLERNSGNRSDLGKVSELTTNRIMSCGEINYARRRKHIESLLRIRKTGIFPTSDWPSSFEKSTFLFRIGQLMKHQVAVVIFPLKAHWQLTKLLKI